MTPDSLFKKEGIMRIEDDKISISMREGILLLCAMLVVMPLFFISVYNRPSADDFSYAILTHEAVQQGGGILSILRAALLTDIDYYFHWQGLYTSAFLLSLQPAIFGESYYCLTAPIIFLISYLFLWGAVHIVLKHLLNTTRCFSAIWAFWITAVIFASMPGVTEGLYWFNGAMNYTPWAFADCLIIALVFEAYYLQGRRKTVIVACTSLLAFIVSGGNHVTAFENILLLLTASVVLLIFAKKKYSLFPLACAVFGFLIMYVAPGTAIRQDCLPKATVLMTLAASLVYTFKQVNEWFNLSWLLLLLSLTPVLLEIIKKFPPNRFHRFPALELILSFGLLCAMHCVPYYASSYFGFPRLTNVVWIAFLVCSIFDYALVLGYLYTTKLVDIPRLQKLWTRDKWMQPLALLICTAVIFCGANSLTASIELMNGKAASYASEMDERIARFRGPENTIVVPPIKNQTSILFFSDITSDPEIWPNNSIGEYYGGKSIARASASEE